MLEHKTRTRGRAHWHSLLAFLLTASVAGAMGALVGSTQAGASTVPTISVGSRPSGVAVDPATGTVYVANSSGNTVSVIDASTNTVTATISVGQGPSGVAVDPATGTVYVTNSTSTTVSVIDGATNAVTSTISVSARPVGVAVDPTTDTVYVANYNGNNFSVINGSTNFVAHIISVGSSGPNGVAVDPATDTVYITNYNSNTVSVINGSTDTLTATVSGVSRPTGVAVDPTTDTIYVANNLGRTASVIDGSTNAVSTVSVGTVPVGVAVDPATDTVYVTNRTSDTVSVIDGSTNAVSSTISVGSYPSGVAVDPATGTVYVANYESTTVSYAADGGTAPASTPPTISAPETSATATVGQAMTPVTFSSTGTPTPTITETGSLPDGVSLSSSGVLSGTPTQSGTFPITVTASNGVSPNATTSFTLTVDAPPAISAPETSVTATVGQAMTPVSFSATGYPAPALTETGSLPDGVSLSSSGVLAGTPTQSGAFPMTVTASNGVGSNAVTSFTLTVDAPPAISAPETSATATVGQAMTPVTFSATGYPAPTITETGSLPDGVSLSSSGVLAGTPTQSGTFPITVTASNGVGSNAVTSFTLTVDAPPTISAPETSATATVGQAMTPVAFSVTGTPTPTCSESGVLPGGVSLSSSCVLSGTPSVAGTFTFTVTASNGVGSDAVQSFTLTVTPPPAGGSGTPGVPRFPASPRPGQRPPAVTFTEGTGGSFQILATGTPTPTCALTRGSLPPGLTLSKSCLVSGTPKKPGTYVFSVTASNASGSATQSFVFVVQAPKVIVVHPSGPDYHFTGVLYGALHDRVLSPVVARAVRMATRGKILQTLQSNFGFSVHGRLGRVHVVIQRDLRTVKVPEMVHGQRRLVARRVFFYAGVLVLVEPAHRGALVFHSFADVSLTGKRVHAVAIGDLVTSVRVRVRAKVHGRVRLVWRVRKVAHPLRLAIEMAPSIS